MSEGVARRLSAGPSERCLLTLFAGLSITLLCVLVTVSKQQETVEQTASSQQVMLKWLSPFPTPSTTPSPSATPSLSPTSSVTPSRSATAVATGTPSATPSASPSAPPLHPVLSVEEQWKRLEALPCVDTYQPLNGDASCAQYDLATSIPQPWVYQYNGYKLPPTSAESQATQRIVNSRGCAGVWRETKHVCVPPAELPGYWNDIKVAFPAAHSFVDGYIDGSDYVPPRSRLPVCSEATEDSEMRAGSYDKDTGYWKPDTCRLPTGITRSKLKQCLRGKRVAIMGDSLMRQMYNRLISLIRGDPVTADHYFHQHSWYRWDTRNDTDVMSFLPFGCDPAVIRARPNSTVCIPEDVTDPRFKVGGADPDGFQLMLVWNPVLTDDPAMFDGLRWAGALVEYLAPTGGPDASQALLAWGGTQHLIASLNFWVHLDADQVVEATRAATVMQTYLGTVESLKSVHWIGHPCHGPTRGGDGYMPHLSRDAMVRYKLKQLRAVLQAQATPDKPAKSVHLVDACGFSPFMEEDHRCGDGTHFQTVFEPRAPLSIRGVKGTSTYTTQDFYNFNLLRVVLLQICPEMAGDL